MKTNSTLSGNNDSFILGRQDKDFPDVIEKTVLHVPKKFRDDMNVLQQHYNLQRGLVIDVSLRELSILCERDYVKVEAYRGLKNFLLYNYGVTLNIHSQKTKPMEKNDMEQFTINPLNCRKYNLRPKR